MADSQHSSHRFIFQDVSYLKPPKFEHIFVAVITFSPFLLCKYFLYQLVAYCVCFKMIYKRLYRHLFLVDISKHARVTHFLICGRHNSKAP